jgi:hypothetical protein
MIVLIMSGIVLERRLVTTCRSREPDVSKLVAIYEPPSPPDLHLKIKAPNGTARH